MDYMKYSCGQAYNFRIQQLVSSSTRPIFLALAKGKGGMPVGA